MQKHRNKTYPAHPLHHSVWKIHEQHSNTRIPEAAAESRSLSLLCCNRGENVKNAKAGQCRPGPPHGGGHSGGDQSSVRPGEPRVTRNAPPGKSGYWSDSKSGKRLTRVLPGLCQRAAAGSRGGPGAGREGGNGAQHAKAPEGKGRRRRAARGRGELALAPLGSERAAQGAHVAGCSSAGRRGTRRGEARGAAGRRRRARAPLAGRKGGEDREVRWGARGQGAGPGDREDAARGAGGRRPATSRCRGGRGGAWPTRPRPSGPAPRRAWGVCALPQTLHSRLCSAARSQANDSLCVSRPYPRFPLGFHVGLTPTGGT